MNKGIKLIALVLSLAVVIQCAAKGDSRFDARIKTHSHVSTELACLSNQQLMNLLEQADFISGGWGMTYRLTVDGTAVFVKLIPLTDLERRPENVLSTANLFDLPLFYQYGVGSAGFGAWRELAANIMATNWVISGECENFPLLYHWRVLELAKPESLDAQELKELEEVVHYWDNSVAVKNRLEALHNACAHVVLFSEYIPQTADQWLGNQLKLGGISAESAVSFVDEQLKTIVTFMNSHGMLHFDAHFKNILTDGTMLYFTDFGLALSTKFTLTRAETEFFNIHRNYDRLESLASFNECVIRNLFDTERLEIPFSEVLHEYLEGERGEVAPSIAVKIKQYAPIALEFDELFEKLRNETKLTPYPADKIDRMCATLG